MSNLNGAIKVVLADSQALTLDGMRSLLHDAGGISVAGATSEPREVSSLVASTKPDVVLLEARMLSEMGRENVAHMRAAKRDLKIILLSEEESAARTASIAPPETKGILLRTSDGEALVSAIRAVAEGKAWEMPARTMPPETAPRSKPLSPREQDIALLVSQGLSNRDIAQRLELSEQSVKNLVSRILKKKGFINRVQIALERWSVATKD